MTTTETSSKTNGRNLLVAAKIRSALLNQVGSVETFDPIVATARQEGVTWLVHVTIPDRGNTPRWALALEADPSTNPGAGWVLPRLAYKAAEAIAEQVSQHPMEWEGARIRLVTGPIDSETYRYRAIWMAETMEWMGTLKDAGVPVEVIAKDAVELSACHLGPCPRVASWRPTTGWGYSTTRPLEVEHEKPGSHLTGLGAA